MKGVRVKDLIEALGPLDPNARVLLAAIIGDGSASDQSGVFTQEGDLGPSLEGYYYGFRAARNEPTRKGYESSLWHVTDDEVGARDWQRDTVKNGYYATVGPVEKVVIVQWAKFAKKDG